MMNYEAWLAEVPATITNDALWRTEVYRLALFMGDLAWRDTRKLVKNPGMVSLSDQLYRATGSVSANISEGYSRASGKDQARFYEYALGSAREARDWYFKSRHILGPKVTDHRLDLLTQIIRHLLKMIPKYRGKTIKEENASYNIISTSHLLQEIPLPED
jgi:four helix bundle protein